MTKCLHHSVTAAQRQVDTYLQYTMLSNKTQGASIRLHATLYASLTFEATEHISTEELYEQV
jgi:hypothetical protein